MKKGRLAAVVALLSLIVGSVYTVSKATLSYVNTSNSITATGAIILNGRFECSGTEIGDTSDGDGVFLTARHCATDLDTNEVHHHMLVSFSGDEMGPFYVAEPMAISLTEDIALLRLHNGAGLPKVKLEDDRHLTVGDPIYNVSFPLSTGKLVFHGQFMASHLGHFPEMLANYPVWVNAMPMNMTIAHGSSGSGVYDTKTGKLIGIAVGTFSEGSFNLAIPSHRIIDFLKDLKDNTVDKFVVYNPIKEAPVEFF